MEEKWLSKNSSLRAETDPPSGFSRASGLFATFLSKIANIFFLPDRSHTVETEPEIKSIEKVTLESLNGH